MYKDIRKFSALLNFYLGKIKPPSYDDAPPLLINDAIKMILAMLEHC